MSASITRLNSHRIFACTFAFLLIAGETYVVTTTSKFWPLALDDYVLCIALLASAFLVKRAEFTPIFMVIWAIMLGNLYAMLFTRMDPVSGSGLRLGPLVVLLLLTAVGTLWSTRIWFRASKGTAKLNHRNW